LFAADMAMLVLAWVPLLLFAFPAADRRPTESLFVAMATRHTQHALDLGAEALL
jgi:hypothetical protein